MNLIVKDPLQRKIEIANWIILVILFIPSLIFAPFKFSLGVLLGGFISILNFYWMERGLRGIFPNTAAMLKVLLWQILHPPGFDRHRFIFPDCQWTVNVIGLLIGLSVVVINIIINDDYRYGKKKIN